MTDYWLQWILLVTVFGAAVMAPGPDFVMAVRNSVLYSRKVGIFTALGFALGFCVHMIYTMAGIAALVAKSVVLFSIFKYAGAAYLFYIGYKALKSKGFEGRVMEGPERAQATMTRLQALRSGFLTNLLNPKATLFCLAIFSQFIHSGTPVSVQFIYGLTCFLMIWGWFSGVAIVLSQQTIRGAFLKAAHWIDRVCGALFIGLGLKLALTRTAS